MSTEIDRKNAILDLLKNNGTMTCEMIRDKLKEQYHVSRRTVLRDIEDLSRHYPIVTSKGRGGGVTYSFHLGKSSKRLFWRLEIYEKLYEAACRMKQQEDIEMWDAVLKLDMEKCFTYDPVNGEGNKSILMDIQEFAEYLKISPTTAYEILKGEEFSFVVQGYNRKVINRSLFEKWISEHTGPSGISGTDIETGGDEKHG